MVTSRDWRGQLSNCGVEDLDVVGDRVGPGVARAQLRGQGLTGLVGEDEERVEPEALLLGRGRLLLELRVHVDERGVEVQDHGVTGPRV